MTSSCVQKTKPKQGSYLLIRRDQSSDVVALRVLVDELDVANQQLARRLGLLEAILNTFVGRDRLFFSVDELECVDETVGRSGTASEDQQGMHRSPQNVRLRSLRAGADCRHDFRLFLHASANPSALSSSTLVTTTGEASVLDSRAQS